MRRIGVLIAVISGFGAAHASARSPVVGDEFEISRSYHTSGKSSDGSSGSSNGRDTVVERVIAVRDSGLELEYDFPSDAKSEAKARDWTLPARIFRPTNGLPLLLNGADLEARIEIWLTAANMTRANCGRWIFTWNLGRIECDPNTVIKTLEAFDLRSADLREGVPYSEFGALGSGKLEGKSSGSGRSSFAVTLKADPDFVRRVRAESDVVVAEIMQRPLSLNEAIRERSKDVVTGTVLVTFETDPAGDVWRKTTVTRLRTKQPDGKIEDDTTKVTIERNRVSVRPAQSKHSEASVISAQ